MRATPGVFTGIAVIAVIATAAPAVADDYPRLEVELGKTAQVDVGQRRGMICDDLSINTPDLRTRDDEHNVVFVTGKALGSTLCRIGTEQGQIGIVYDVHVVPVKKKRSTSS